MRSSPAYVPPRPAPRPPPRGIWSSSIAVSYFFCYSAGRAMRARWVKFCDEVVERAAEAGGLSDEVLIGAEKASFTRLHGIPSDAHALAKAKSLLALSAIRERIGERIGLLYEERGFTLLDAVDKHIAHMNEGSWPALDRFLRMIMPSEPSRHQHVVAQVTGLAEDGKLPPMAARMLSVGPKSDNDA